ncbi:Transmembrane nucleoporin [Rhizina undulata]
MAPPPPATLPLSQRLMALAQTLQFAWFVGHLTLLITTIRYAIDAVKFTRESSYTAVAAYRLAFLSAAATYGIVVYKAYRPKVRNGQMMAGGLLVNPQQVLKVLGDENVQYLFMALVWLYCKPIFYALLPFAVYSTFHFLTYVRTNLIPTLFPAGTPTSPAASSPRTSQPAVSEAIAKFVKANYEPSMHLVAHLELFLWLRIAGGALILSNSWILLILYTVFIRARYAQSPFVRDALKALEKRLDALMADQKVPEGVRNVWGVVKGVVRNFGEATDVSRILGSTPRKTQ